MQKSRLPYKYANELHCNEVILLPYYIASMNIEHAYYELTSSYQSFEGICLVDTFDLAEEKQFPLMTEENTARVKRQQEMPIFVVIGNPPYNAGQVNENDNNKNRKYKAMDKRVAETYAKDSKATYKADLNDPYVKAFRWGSDRILPNGEGIVALVTNNNFLDGIAFDGIRKHLSQDFDAIYVLDLGGNVRKNPKLSGTTHNVFGIQVGVSINLLIKKKGTTPRQARIYYARLDEFWRKEQKYDFLDSKDSIGNVVWEEKKPDARHNWLTEGMRDEFESFLPLGTKEAKNSRNAAAKAIFKLFSLGVATNRDPWVYSFDLPALKKHVAAFVETYEAMLDGVRRRQPKTAEEVIDTTDQRIKWTRQVKSSLLRHDETAANPERIRTAIYRPFTKQHLYYDDFWNEERYQTHRIFPLPTTEMENLAICTNTVGTSKPFHCLMTNVIPDLHLTGDTQCFPFYAYAEDGSNRRENITDWALEQFRAHYQDERISKWDIFHYIYGVLHHSQYREKYAANLKRELPRIPFASDFRGFAEAGAKLADLHVNYEKQAEYPLQRLENKDARLNWRVERMRLSKDKTQIAYNDFLTVGGIPSEVFEYRLGNRSALEWIVDQYRVSTDKRSGIVTDPNRTDDPEYIVRLIGKVITVSLETVKVVKSLPSLQ